MSRCLAFVMLVTVLLAGCGDDGESRTGTSGPTDTTAAVIGPGELLDQPDPRYVVVRGFLVMDGSGARICEALAESYPPQCGGASVTIGDPEQLDPEIDLEEANGVRWTNSTIDVGGYFDGKNLILLEQAEDAN